MQIEPQDLVRKLAAKDKPVVLDVRTSQETQAEGTIAGALLIPLDQLPAQVPLASNAGAHAQSMVKRVDRCCLVIVLKQLFFLNFSSS